MYEQPRCDIFAVSTPWQSRFVGRDKIAVDRRWHNRCSVTFVLFLRLFLVNVDTMSPGKVRYDDRGDNLFTRKVRTPQSTVAANGCPPRGEDQSNRDEPALGSVETGNLYGEQHQIGNCRSCSGRLRVDGLRQGASLVLDEWSSAEMIFQNIIRLIGGLCFQLIIF